MAHSSKKQTRMGTIVEPANAGIKVPTIASVQRFRTKGIDVQLEYVWTVVWSYLSAWTFGAPVVFPLSTPMWNGPGLFFLLCIFFYELRTGSYTNPAYWVKEFFVDEVSQRKFQKAPLDRVLLMSAVDIFGHMTGFFLYLKTLEILGEKAALEIAASPPQYKNCNLFWAIVVEAIVTGGTQLSSTVPEALGLTGRVGNLISSYLGVYILMIWGMPYTGAVMNPASTIAATVVSGRFSKQAVLNPLVLIRISIVFISAPIIGAVMAGVVEGGIERDKVKRADSFLEERKTAEKIAEETTSEEKKADEATIDEKSTEEKPAAEKPADEKTLAEKPADEKKKD